MWWDTILENQHSNSLWGPHLGFPYILIPLGMTFLALQYLVGIGKEITALKTTSKDQSEVSTTESPSNCEPPNVTINQKGDQAK
jgi:TRAP-type C4-dicarboxylate transport system permease small subunit